MFLVIVVLFVQTKHLDCNKRRRVLEFEEYLKKVRKRKKEKKKKNLKNQVNEPKTAEHEVVSDTTLGLIDEFEYQWKEYWNHSIKTFTRNKFCWKEYWKKIEENVSHVLLLSTTSIETGFNAIFRSYLPEEEGAHDRNVYAIKGTNKMPIVFDSGASTSLTPVRDDFIGELQTPPTSLLYSINSKINVVGTGIVAWHVYDVYVVTRVIKTKAHYIPEASIRLFSPQVYFKEQGGGEALLTPDYVQLTLKEGTTMQFPYNAGSNLPLMLTKKKQLTVGLTYEDISYLAQKLSVLINLSVADEVNQNITAAQKELLVTHWKAGHANFGWIQALSAYPRAEQRQDLPFFQMKHAKASSCQHPLCAACQIAKQSRRTPESGQTKGINREMTLKQGHPEPGQVVSIDQYMSAIPGRLPNTKGKESKKDRYVGGTIFCDHASKLIWVSHQVSLRAGDIAKRLFVSMASSCSVMIKLYHADNVPFESNEIKRELISKNQEMSLSGTGAHHQNGVAERAIRTGSSWARPIILHMVMHWPEMADLSLWPSTR